MSDSSATLKTAVAFNESRCGAHTTLSIKAEESVSQAMMHGRINPKKNRQAMIANYSSDRKAITLADAQDLAIVVPSTIGKLATFKAPTFGALSQCKPITAQCSQVVTQKNCSNLGIAAIPTDPNVIGSVALIHPFDK
ncbi:hypothetical protein FRC07_010444 [Ceratobasidium sp. 392]|nr:hypothetical protein FRC07_010444 [Ceratobasidium sp. 392]